MVSGTGPPIGFLLESENMNWSRSSWIPTEMEIRARDGGLGFQARHRPLKAVTRKKAGLLTCLQFSAACRAVAHGASTGTHRNAMISWEFITLTLWM
jgi:hypothetical protein